jgi:hypothetical protein
LKAQKEQKTEPRMTRMNADIRTTKQPRSLQEAWAKTPTGKKRETTHVVRCEAEIFRVKNSQT